METEQFFRSSFYKNDYTAIITNPCDCSTYKIPSNIFIRNDLKITINSFGGSEEKIKWRVQDGVIYIITPIFAVNPKYIKVTITL